jgi:integral membrane sensor domain MASE1
VVFGAINLLEATVAFLLLRRWRFNPRFAVPSDITKFLIAGAILGALVAA